MNQVFEQGLEDKEYQRHRDELVNLLMSLKDKIKIEDLILYEPIFTLNIRKSKCSIVKDLLIFIILIVIIILSGYVLTIGNNIHQKLIRNILKCYSYWALLT